jgi:integrase/recombinase XerC
MTFGLPFLPDSADWLDAMHGEGRSSSTIECYGRDLRDVSAALGSIDVAVMATLDQDCVDRVAAIWDVKGASSTTVYRRFSALRGFAQFLIRHRGMDCGRLLAANFPALHRVRLPGFSEQEAAALVDASLIAAGDWVGRRDAAIFAVQSESALTTAEVVALNREDIGTHAISIRNTAFAPRVAAFSDRPRAAVSGYLLAVPFDISFDGPLFVNERGTRISVRTVQLRFRHRARTVGIPPGRGPGSLRTGTGTLLASSGNSPAVVAEALGLHAISAFRFFNLEGRS